jgi:hypothetical protein
VIGEVLNCIKLLLTKSDDLKSTYGVNESRDADGHLCASTVLISAKRTKIFQDSFDKLQGRLLKQRKQTNLIQRSKWAIVDKDKFGTLLTNLNGLVSALYDLVPVVPSFQRLMVKEDLEAVPEHLPSLKVLQQACSGRKVLQQACSGRKDDWSD